MIVHAMYELYKKVVRAGISETISLRDCMKFGYFHHVAHT